jgi:hypothetical protein
MGLPVLSLGLVPTFLSEAEWVATETIIRRVSTANKQ